MGGRGKEMASNWLAWGVGILLLTAAVVIGLEMAHRPSSIARITVGTRDQVYYSRGATAAEAAALGRALQSLGFLNDRGTSVMLSRAGRTAVLSFVLQDGGWDHPETVASFEEIGRRVAGAIGGFPIQVRLVDSAWTARKSLAVGKQTIGSRDVVYYLGLATDGDARALGQALRDAGYLQDLGVSVVVGKDGGTTIGFVVGDGVWDRADAAAAFENLTRRVAASVGGLPVQMRLLDEQMETKRQAAVR